MLNYRFRTAIGVTLMALAAFASIASGDENVAKSSSGEAAKSFKVGEPVTLGDWGILVHAVKDPQPATSEFNKPKPGNRWVGVDVQVWNNSKKATTVSSFMCFEIQDSESRSYDEAIFADSESSGPDGEVDPGASRRGDIVFEVPTAATGLKLRFKCDLFSTGSAVVDL